ncbi:META domain-containing protein [Aquibium carbonis]|nr:META domain-containing protein [Aquibium carbonis]
MKLPQLAAVFLSLGVGIAGVMAVEASAERARVIAGPSSAKALAHLISADDQRTRSVDSAIVGGWRILGVADAHSGGYTPFTAALAAAARVDIAADGQARATAGCNAIAAGITQTGDAWHAGPAAMTRMACPDPAVMAAEQSIARALSEAVMIELDGRRATLGDAAGATMMVLERE